MKRIVMFFAAAMLLFGISGQALASFAAGDLIQVVYSTTDSYEVATDLGAFAPTQAYTGSTITFNTNPFPTAGTGAFANSSWSNINVAYFESAGSSAWVSGPTTGTQTSGNSQSNFSSAAAAVLASYASAGAGSSQAQLLKSNALSYMSQMNMSTLTGSFAGLIPGANGETNLAALGNGPNSYVDSYLYYYATTNLSSSQTGLPVADIRTFADGTSEIVGTNATPVPPSVLLMGSGLIGLAGIKRKVKS